MITTLVALRDRNRTMLVFHVYVDEPSDIVALVRYFRSLTGRGPLELKQAATAGRPLASLAVHAHAVDDTRTLKKIGRQFPNALWNLRFVEQYTPEHPDRILTESFREVPMQYVKNILHTHDQIAREVRTQPD